MAELVYNGSHLHNLKTARILLNFKIMYSSASASRRLLQLATAPGLLRRLGDKPYSLDSFQSSSSSSSPPWQTQGFERVTEIRQSALKSKQCPPSELDDSNHNVFLFPGQGTQFVGMGKRLLEVPSVPDMYDRASQILNLDLLKLCLEGPQSSLNQTLHCQAAVVVTSLAAIERLYHEDPKIVERCVAAAGFSVGEITALIFSGAISFDDGIATFSLVVSRLALS